MPPLAITNISPKDLRPSPRNARTHPRRQVDQLKASIVEHGFVSPILCDEQYGVIAGHGRLMAAKELGLTSIPVIILRGLSETQKRKLMLADNKIAANAGWDMEVLAAELSDFIELGTDFTSTGFNPAEIDQILFDHEADSADPADVQPDLPGRPVSMPGDLWLLGKHRLVCGGARDATDLERVLGSDRAAMAFLDCPYNTEVSGIVGRGKVKHSEFAMASGEMDTDQFRA